MGASQTSAFGEAWLTTPFNIIFMLSLTWCFQPSICRGHWCLYFLDIKPNFQSNLTSFGRPWTDLSLLMERLHKSCAAPRQTCQALMLKIYSPCWASGTEIVYERSQTADSTHQTHSQHLYNYFPSSTSLRNSRSLRYAYSSVFERWITFQLMSVMIHTM